MAIDRKNRALFERLGVDFTRIDIAIGSVINSSQLRTEALEWLSEQVLADRRRENRRFWLLVTLTCIAAIAACIAAIPVLRGH
jgi:hypothetical protein